MTGLERVADVAGSRVLVTGGTSGIGRAIASAFVDAGARVVLTGRDRQRAQEVAGSLTGDGRAATGVGLDVRDERAVSAVIPRIAAELGGLDVLVNNAGVGVRFLNEHYLTTPLNFWELSPDRFRALLETNIDGYFLCSRAAVPLMLAAGRGRIINISINEATMRRPRFIPYGPSRAATDEMSYAMAAELAGTGVTVNLLSPGGATATAMITEEADPEFRAQLLDPMIMGPAARWLASDEAAGVTGQKIVAKEFSARRWPAPDRGRSC